MASLRVKLSPTHLLGQALAVFITLSVSVECLQCYWCGPLAEQVHRSQRAPSCDESVTNVTTCEPGYTHCAVVASSPPFVESRYCVKFYQDECYTLYCGTTKRYRTTCPCRGELCNGPTTAREADAFAALAATVAKTHNNRIAKRSAISNGLIIGTKYTKGRLIENEPSDEMSNTVENNNDNINETATQTEPPQITENEIIQTTIGTKVVDNNDLSASEPHDSETNAGDMQNDEAIVTLEEVTITTKTIENNVEAENVNHDDAAPKAVEVKQDDVTTSAPAEANVKMEEESFVHNEIKPSAQLPTAEALLQSVSPDTNSGSEKPLEPMSTVTVGQTVTEAIMHMTTTEHDHNMMMENPTKITKNSSETLSISIFNILIAFMSIFLIAF